MIFENSGTAVRKISDLNCRILQFWKYFKEESFLPRKDLPSESIEKEIDKIFSAIEWQLKEIRAMFHFPKQEKFEL